MGEVYRAHDGKLGRVVAIKILPPALTADPDRVARFEREARVLASLNHPNIAAIYGLEQSDGVTALVLELVDGETLADRIRRGPVPLRDALAIARQIAGALDAAHERGIVHRDLKPANVIVTAGNVVKVLDFGLAKDADAPTADALTHSPTMLGQTVPGVLLGTAPYMSPEQARGKAVDKRTDIWAFGCVLYEMLTGRRAFPGETTSDAIAAILEREPDWSRLPVPLPRTVDGVLRRCLEKDPKQRLRDIGDVHFDADDAHVHRPRSRSALWAPWALWSAMAAAVVVGAASFATRLLAPPASPQAARVERVTYEGSRAQSPALSPDGRLLAFASDRAGRGDLDIWVQQVAGGTPVRVTDDPGDDSDPDFSADGSMLAFRSERGGGGVYLTSPLGGGSPRLVVAGGRNPRLSPDGRSLAYWTGQFRGDPSATASSLFVVALDGGAPVQVAKDFFVSRNPVWAPDSRSLIFVGRRDAKAPLAETFDWWWAPLDGRAPVRTGAFDLGGWRELATRERVTVGSWTADGVIVAESGNIWALPISPSSGRVAGPAAIRAHGAGLYRDPAASRDGQIVFVESSAQRVIERAPLAAIPAVDPPIELYADGSGVGGRASQTRDGSIVVFERRADRRNEIWRKAMTTGQQEMVLSVESLLAVNPTVSPDGSHIAYTVADAGRQSVTVNGRAFIVDTSGGVPRPLCDNCGAYQFLSDNRRSVVAVGDALIRTIDIASGATRDLVAGNRDRIERPSVSPDDHAIAWRRTTGTVAKVLISAMPGTGEGPIEHGMEIDEPTTTGRPAGWSDDSRTLYLLLDTDGYRCLWGQRVDERGHLVGKPFAARHFHDRRGANAISTSLGNAIAPTGFLYETNRVTSDLWRLAPPSTTDRR